MTPGRLRSSAMRSVLRSVLPWALLALVLALWTPGYVYDPASSEVTSALDKLWAVSFLAFPMVGFFLARRLPVNPVGWLFLVGPALIGAGVSLGEYGEAMGLDLATLSDGVFTVGLVVMFSSILVFPDGRYPNRWYRRAHITGIVGVVFSPVLSPDATGLAVAFNLLLPIAALIHRAWRGDAVVRRQIAGPILAVFIGLLPLLLLSVKGFFVTSGDDRVDTLIGTVASMILSIGIPVSIAIAITRYRLYEIDRIVSRTISYLVVVGLLAVVFFGVVTAIGSLLQTESDLAIAASTLAVAALFNPVRKRVQGWVDRRFNRSRYDAQRVMDRFAGSLRDRVDSDEVVEGWVGVVSETMQPASVAVWVREGR
ncbi:MAG: hypothetical protein ACRDX9_17230 [Acidimicrobiia bacterium]